MSNLNTQLGARGAGNAHFQPSAIPSYQHGRHAPGDPEFELLNAPEPALVVAPSSPSAARASGPYSVRQDAVAAGRLSQDVEEEQMRSHVQVSRPDPSQGQESLCPKEALERRLQALASEAVGKGEHDSSSRRATTSRGADRILRSSAAQDMLCRAMEGHAAAVATRAAALALAHAESSRRFAHHANGQHGAGLFAPDLSVRVSPASLRRCRAREAASRAAEDHTAAYQRALTTVAIARSGGTRPQSVSADGVLMDVDSVADAAVLPIGDRAVDAMKQLARQVMHESERVAARNTVRSEQLQELQKLLSEATGGVDTAVEKMAICRLLSHALVAIADPPGVPHSAPAPMGGAAAAASKRSRMEEEEAGSASSGKGSASGASSLRDALRQYGASRRPASSSRTAPTAFVVARDVYAAVVDVSPAGCGSLARGSVARSADRSFEQLAFSSWSARHKQQQQQQRYARPQRAAAQAAATRGHQSALQQAHADAVASHSGPAAGMRTRQRSMPLMSQSGEHPTALPHATQYRQ